MKKVVFNARELDGYLTEADIENLAFLDELYRQAMNSFSQLVEAKQRGGQEAAEKNLIQTYNKLGAKMQEICAKEKSIRVYSFATPPGSHGEASRLIAKLRDYRTGRQEFIYYTQRAYELLFNLAFNLPLQNSNELPKKNHLIIQTPVTSPLQNYAVHKIPNFDSAIENSVMCVLLRGALLPSIIMSKEIQEYSSHGYITPFALFKIHREDGKQEADLEYILDLERSYFRPKDLDGKDLLFADPMNATGGSMITVIRYLASVGVQPKSIQCLNAISAIKGALRITRILESVSLYTLWMDPMLNAKAYIMPGLGDAGDRMNGMDDGELPRDIIQLVANFGSNVSGLYRSQLSKIEDVVLHRKTE